MSYFTKGQEALKPDEVKICVLYDPKNGRIAHYHMVAVFPGGKRVDEKEIERRTVARAASFGTDTSRFKPLRVSEKDCDPSCKYKVDIKTLKLIELPKPDHLAFKGGTNRRKKPAKRAKRGPSKR